MLSLDGAKELASYLLQSPHPALDKKTYQLTDIFSYKAPCLCNELPHELPVILKVPNFQIYTKTHLLQLLKLQCVEFKVLWKTNFIPLCL